MRISTRVRRPMPRRPFPLAVTYDKRTDRTTVGGTSPEPRRFVVASYLLLQFASEHIDSIQGNSS